MKTHTDPMSERTSVAESDRREYFRVSCDAEINISPFPTDTSVSGNEQDLKKLFAIQHTFTLRAELMELDVEANQILRQISDHDKNIGHFLRILNQKIELVSRILATSQANNAQDLLTRINLSEGGISTHYSQRFEENTLVAVKVNLLPDHLGILAKCIVKACQASEHSEGGQLNLEFVDLEANTQQIIARFLAREQRRHLSNHLTD